MQGCLCQKRSMRCKEGKGHLPEKASLICHAWRGCTLLLYLLILCCPTALVAFLSLQLKCKPLQPSPSRYSAFAFLIPQTVYSCLENPRDRSMVGCHLWGRTMLHTTEVT